MNTTYSAAFSVFFMQSPSFLAYQRHLQEGHGRSNCEGLFGISKIPSDNHIRDMPDPADPALLYPMFPEVLGELEQSGGLSAFRRLGNHVLIALDGSEYFRSNKINCAHCSTRLRGKGKDNGAGKIEYFHVMLGATLVAPGHNQVVPLEPEFVSPQDGAEKQDCETRAVQRWLAKHGAQYTRLNPIYLGDDLHARQPTCKAVLAASGNFVFVCKPDSHPLIQEYITGIELPSHAVLVKSGHKRFTHRYRWLSDVPLRDGDDAMKVNWLEIEIHDADGNVTYRNSFITDLPVNRDNVAELTACGRPDGRSRTRRSIPSRPAAITSSTTSDTASRTLPPSSPRSICCRSPSTPSATTPRNSGAGPDRRSVHGCSSSPVWWQSPAS